MQRRLERGILGIPAIRPATLGETIEAVHEQFLENCQSLKRTPKWCGELYFEYHRGTLTSVPRVKYNNRKGEFALQNGEGLSVLAQKAGLAYPKKELERNWKLLLLNQFHDVLPGSSIEKVYLDSDVQFQQLFQELKELEWNAVTVLAKNLDTKGGILVFNPNGFTASIFV